MSKPVLVFQGPVESRSGYGDHARDLVYSLIKSDKYDVKIVSMPWGATPMNGLEINDEIDIQIKNSIIKEQLHQQPDIFIQISVPNEFTPIGKYANIGITAGIETTQCAPEWIEGINRMDITLVPSKFSKETFIQTSYSIYDKNTNQPRGELNVQKAIDILFEGVDTSVFKKIEQDELENTIKLSMDGISEEFVFLSVGHWLSGDFGEDRKNISGLIYTFIDTFKNLTTPKPALLLKTSGATFSIKDKNRIIEKINAIKGMFPKENDLPNIYLLHGNLSKKEMNSLYNHEKIKAMVSFTKGEGFGRPLLEFAVTGKPVIASGFSGHVDFLNPAFHTMLPGELTEIHKSAVWEGVLVKGSKWFTVNYQEASKILLDVFKNYKKYKYESIKFLNHIDKWSLKRMQELFIDMLEKNISVPKHVEIKLPKLKKIE